MVCAFKYSQILRICTEIATVFYGLVKSVKWNSEDTLVFKITFISFIELL